ncbi:MAG: hypothetical protein ACRC5A_00880 [Enterobacteriaceae bacterium]
MNNGQQNHDIAAMLFHQGWEADCQGDFPRAEAHYRESLRFGPEYLNTYTALTLLLSRSNKQEEIDAIWRVCEQRLADPWNPRLHRLLDLLKHAHFDLGFQLREQLFSGQDHHRSPIPPPADYPRWQGESLQGRSIVIWTEYGFGDELMLCRFARVLKQAGATQVSVVCQKPILSVVATLRDADLVICDAEVHSLPTHDYWVFPLAIPAYYSLDNQGIPAECPYLYADKQKVAHWQPLLPAAQEGKLRVGLVWKGNTTHENDHFRSVEHLSLLTPILQLDNIQWVSLQKGESEQEWQSCIGPLIINRQSSSSLANTKMTLPCSPLLLGQEINDFSDTAAIMACLDLIISVDTSAAHLAGALAKPVWLLLPTQIDWRWQTNRTDSPWYPTMRLFRQKYHKAWSHPLADMKAQLQLCIQDKNNLKLNSDSVQPQ